MVSVGRPEALPDPGPATWPDGSVRLDAEGNVHWPASLGGRLAAYDDGEWPCWSCGQPRQSRDFSVSWDQGFLCRPCGQARSRALEAAYHQKAPPPKPRGIDPARNPRR